MHEPTLDTRTGPKDHTLTEKLFCLEAQIEKDHKSFSGSLKVLDCVAIIDCGTSPPDRLFLPLACLTENDDGSLSLQMLESKPQPTVRVVPVRQAKDAEAKVLSSLRRRCLRERPPELAMIYESLSLRFFAGSVADVHLYSTVASCLLKKRGPLRGCLPKLDYLHLHGKSLTIYYRINLEMSRTPQVLNSARLGLYSIVSSMFSVISDLASFGMTIDKFDPAEDIMLGQDTFQFISLAKLRLTSPSVSLHAYLKSVLEGIKSWVLGFQASYCKDISIFLQKQYKTPTSIYEKAKMRVDYLFFNTNTLTAGSMYLPSTCYNLASQMSDSDDSSARESVFNTFTDRNSQELQKYTLGKLSSRSEYGQQSPNNKLKELEKSKKKGSSFLDWAADQFDQELNALDTQLVLEEGCLDKKLSLLNNHHGSMKLLSKKSERNT